MGRVVALFTGADPNPARLPAFALRQRGDMRDVMLAVPCVHRERRIESHPAAPLGMNEVAEHLLGGHRAEHRDPANVKRVEQGERMGLIRFGSRVDVFVPPGSSITVKVGDTTVAGTTVIAELAAK